MHTLICVVMMEILRGKYGEVRITGTYVMNLLRIRTSFWNYRIRTEVKL